MRLPNLKNIEIPATSDWQTEVVTFLLQFGLAEMWKSWGIEPDSLMGFGIGQYTAACLAGVLSAEDAVPLVARRAEICERFGNQTFGVGPAGESDPELKAELDKFEELADTFNCFPPDRPLICSLTAESVPVHRQLGLSV